MERENEEFKIPTSYYAFRELPEAVTDLRQASISMLRETWKMQTSGMFGDAIPQMATASEAWNRQKLVESELKPKGLDDVMQLREVSAAIIPLLEQHGIARVLLGLGLSLSLNAAAMVAPIAGIFTGESEEFPDLLDLDINNEEARERLRLYYDTVHPQDATKEYFGGTVEDAAFGVARTVLEHAKHVNGLSNHIKKFGMRCNEDAMVFVPGISPALYEDMMRADLSTFDYEGHKKQRGGN